MYHVMIGAAHQRTRTGAAAGRPAGRASREVPEHDGRQRGRGPHPRPRGRQALRGEVRPGARRGPLEQAPARHERARHGPEGGIEAEERLVRQARQRQHRLGDVKPDRARGGLEMPGETPRRPAFAGSREATRQRQAAAGIPGRRGSIPRLATNASTRGGTGRPGRQARGCVAGCRAVSIGRAREAGSCCASPRCRARPAAASATTASRRGSSGSAAERPLHSGTGAPRTPGRRSGDRRARSTPQSGRG